MVFANGKKYEGDLVEGIQQGVGTIDELDGYTYTGKFNNGLKNGYFCKTKKQIIRGVTNIITKEPGRDQYHSTKLMI